MVLANEILLTREGWVRLHEELHTLESERHAIMDAQREFARATEPGEAIARYLPQDMALLDRRIAHLEEVLSRAVPVSSGDREPGTAGVGSEVSVSWDDGAEETYVIVGTPEVDLDSGRISYESPVGQALLGAHEGEWVEVTTPGGQLHLRVVAVS